MNVEKKIQDEVEKTIASLDQDGVLSPNPFLVTRIQAARDTRVQKHRLLFAVKMNLGYIALIVILLVNVVTLVRHAREAHESLQQQLVSDLREELQIDQSPFNF
jgi:hypothetical protein